MYAFRRILLLVAFIPMFAGGRPAYAAGPVVVEGDIVLAVCSDLHLGANKWQTGGASWETLVACGEAAQAMGAIGILGLGDDFGGKRQTGYSGGCTWPSTLRWVSGSPIPCTLEGSLWTTQLATIGTTYGIPAGQVWPTSGNHDDTPADATNTNLTYRAHGGFLKQYTNPCGKSGVDCAGQFGNVFQYAVSFDQQIAGVTVRQWEFDSIGDQNSASDYARGGRCGRDTQPTDCFINSFGMGEVKDDQLQWLRYRINRADVQSDTGIPRSLILGMHEPPPNTTIGSWEDEGINVPVCTDQYFFGPDSTIDYSIFPAYRGASYGDLPAPAPWDHSQTLLEAVNGWGGANLAWTATGPDGAPAPDPTWFSTLLADQYTEYGVEYVSLVLAGHEHLEVPDETSAAGHSTLATVSDGVGTVKVIATGGVTTSPNACTTNGRCKPMAGKLTLHPNGTWEYERWDLDKAPAARGCTTASTPATAVPGPFGGLVNVTGP